MCARSKIASGSARAAPMWQVTTERAFFSHWKSWFEVLVRYLEATLQPTGTCFSTAKFAISHVWGPLLKLDSHFPSLGTIAHIRLSFSKFGYHCSHQMVISKIWGPLLALNCHLFSLGAIDHIRPSLTKFRDHCSPWNLIYQNWGSFLTSDCHISSLRTVVHIGRSFTKFGDGCSH